MLTTNISFGGDPLVRYFKEGYVREGKYYIEGSIQAHWSGKTSEYLGIAGKDVTEGDFSKISQNINPITDEKLTVRNASNRRSATDWTFSAPKSVSLLYGLFRDQKVLKAHLMGIEAAKSKIEELMYTQNNDQFGRRFIHTGNALFCVFTHETARPVLSEKEGEEPKLTVDCALHSHVVQPNVTWNPKLQRFNAVETLGAMTSAPYLEKIYHSVVSKELQKAGYGIEITNNGYEIANINKDILTRFSQRSNEINRIAEENGLGKTAKAKLGAKTRLNKSNLKLTREEMQEEWKSRLTPEEYTHLKNLKGKTSDKSKQNEISVREAIDLSIENFLERDSAAQTNRIKAHALSLGYGNLTDESVTKELNSRSNIIHGKRDIIDIMTTKEMLQQEQELIKNAVAGKGKFLPINKGFQPSNKLLNEQQEQAAKGLLRSADQIMLMRGSAGVGKTTTLKMVKEGVGLAGKSFFVVAPTTQATQTLIKEGFDAQTVAALLANTNEQARQELQNSVLCVDEAGMVPLKSMNELIGLGKQYNMRMILAGDSKQLSAPAAYGDPYQLIERHSGVSTFTIDKIMRQKPDQYRSAIQDISKGRVLKGYDTLSKLGAIKEIPDNHERLNKLADDYVQSLSQSKKPSSLIVSATNYEGKLINDIVRKKLREKGKLGKKEIEFDTLRSLSLTNAQKKVLQSYTTGDVVRFNKYQKGFKAGTHHEIINVSKEGNVQVKDLKTGLIAHLPIAKPEYYEVYSKEKTPISEQDTIRLTNNTKSICESGSKLSNGTSYQVRKIHQDKRIELSNGKIISADTYHFKHGYSETAYSSQSKTSKNVFISISDLSKAATNDKAFYVAASRGTHQISIYCQEKEELRKVIQKSGDRMSAKQVADSQELELQRKRQLHHKTFNQQVKTNEQVQRRQKVIARSVSKEFSGR
ncbi:MAG: MobF family relaxase [Cyclobacteriaceae bacterium]